MRVHIAVIAALIGAALFFNWVGTYAKTHGVNRDPEKTFLYTLSDKITDSSGQYVVPVLFPYDLIVLLLLAGSLAAAGAIWGPLGLGGPPLYYVVLPLAYLVFDLAEDSLLALILTDKVAIVAVTRVLLQVLTAGKLATVVLSMVQAGLAAVVALYRCWG
jgi:hypothetical protein